MVYRPIEDLLKHSENSVYKLIHMAAKRAGELSDGKRPLIDSRPSTKTATIALEEIAQGKVKIRNNNQKLTGET